MTNISPTAAVAFSEKRIKTIVLNLLFVMPILGMAVDLIAPSLPGIAKSLQISAGMAKNVISIYLLGYAFGNFLTGFLTDAYGRRKLICCGLFGFVIASLLPALFPNLKILLLARCLQGLTIGGVSVAARATFSDILLPEN